MLGKKWLSYFLGTVTFLAINSAFASLIVPMYSVSDDGKGKNIGVIVAEDAPYGVLLTPRLHDLSPGIHGFHIHEKPSCTNKAMGAGDHLDPENTAKHEGPYESGHLGDLPVLVVNQDGTATLPMLAPRFKDVAAIKKHAFIIHAGSDNYADKPEKNGGGRDRIACGVTST